MNQLLQVSLVNVTSVSLWGSPTTDTVKVCCVHVYRLPKALISFSPALWQVRLLDLKSGIELSSLVSGYNKNYQVLIPVLRLLALESPGCSSSGAPHLAQLGIDIHGFGVLRLTLLCLAYH